MIGRLAVSGLRGPEDVGRLVQEGQVGQLAHARGGQGPQKAEVEIFEGPQDREAGARSGRSKRSGSQAGGAEG